MCRDNLKGRFELATMWKFALQVRSLWVMAPDELARLQLSTHDVVKNQDYASKTKRDVDFVTYFMKLMDARGVRWDLDWRRFREGRACRDFWQALRNKLSGTSPREPRFSTLNVMSAEPTARTVSFSVPQAKMKTVTSWPVLLWRHTPCGWHQITTSNLDDSKLIFEPDD